MCVCVYIYIYIGARVGGSDLSSNAMKQLSMPQGKYLNPNAMEMAHAEGGGGPRFLLGH